VESKTMGKAVLFDLDNTLTGSRLRQPQISEIVAIIFRCHSSPGGATIFPAI